MLLPSAGPGGGFAPVVIGAGLIYAGVWMVFHPTGAWQLTQGLMDGIQRFESTLHGAPWWSAQTRTSPGQPPAPTKLRLAGVVVAALGVLSLAGGLTQWA